MYWNQNIKHLTLPMPFKFLSTAHKNVLPHLKGMHVSQISLKENSSDLGNCVRITWYFPFSLGQICIKRTIQAKPFKISPPLVLLKCHLHGCLFWHLRFLCCKGKVLTEYKVFWSVPCNPILLLPLFQGRWQLPFCSVIA